MKSSTVSGQWMSALDGGGVCVKIPSLKTPVREKINTIH